uniref:Regulator of G-protein signaling 17-like n=1 Tax=Cyprinus carpio TaxID=7962 RepID=A0A8C2KPL5_CYPCA
MFQMPQRLCCVYHFSSHPRNEDRRERSERQTCKMDSIEATEEQHPTLDEVIAWSRSFEMMMRSPEGRDVFREFLRSEYSEENLMFWMACEELKKETNSSAIDEKARIIYEDYVSILSPKEVSLDSRVREVINQSLAEPSGTMYEEAQLQIYTLMHRDSFPRFLSSSVYRDLLNSKRVCLDT